MGLNERIKKLEVAIKPKEDFNISIHLMDEQEEKETNDPKVREQRIREAAARGVKLIYVLLEDEDD